MRQSATVTGSCLARSCLVVALSLAAGMPSATLAEPITLVSTRIDSKATLRDPFFQENEEFAAVDQHDDGQASAAEVSNHVGEGSGGSVSDSPGLASASGSADLAAAKLKARSYSETRYIDRRVQQMSLTTTATALFGDSFSTANASGSPFDWTSGGTGRFSMHLDGELLKQTAFDTGLEFGTTSWTVRLIATTADDARGVCDWREGIGGFEAGEPFRQYFAVSSEGTSNDCDFSGSLAGGDLELSAGINLGADFDWILSLAASTRIGGPATTRVGGYVERMEADLGNTLDVSYTGPGGTITTAAAFGGIVNPLQTGVPEPAVLALFGLGLLGIGVAHGRRAAPSPGRGSVAS